MNKKIRNIFGILLFSIGFSQITAQETRTISLNEAVEIGINNSKNLKLDAAKIEETVAQLVEAKNNQLPSLKLGASYLHLFSPNVDLKTGNSAASNIKVNNVIYGSANLTYPIFAGGRIKYGIQSAEYLIEASKLNAENDKIAIAFIISQAYNNLFKASQTIKVLEENLLASKKRDETFLKLENNGLMARNDRLKAQLQTSNIELQLLDAHNNYNIANINMNLLLGLPENTVLKIDENYINELPDNQPSSYYLSQAFQNRKDLQAIDYQRKAASIGSKAAKAENLPTIALTGGYFAADVPGLLTVTNAVNVGVGVQYNLDNLWKKNSSLLKAQAREKQLEVNNELLNDQIKLEINKDFQNSVLAKKKIEVYERALEQAEENDRITKNKYDNGLSNITDLLDANAALIGAKVNVINAKADATLANKKLLQSSGILK
ncbi:transporter [Cloacibacterium rupense]|uniref:Transporter n=1 Tax=Cloacibacterium rupense TaxID=517423 RepID=A0ABQ2NL22_9FLAO|nr:TolC family protein [Cloacibacterium rupense]GGP06054.1 transporter [Cloacibacterium rupense]